MRFLLHQVRYGYSFSLSVPPFCSLHPHISFHPFKRTCPPLYLTNSSRAFRLFFPFSFQFPPNPSHLSVPPFFPAPLFTFSLLCTFVENVVIQFIPRRPLHFSPSAFHPPLIPYVPLRFLSISRRLRRLSQSCVLNHLLADWEEL